MKGSGEKVKKYLLCQRLTVSQYNFLNNRNWFLLKMLFNKTSKTVYYRGFSTDIVCFLNNS